MESEEDGYNAHAPFDPHRRGGGWNYRVISWPDTEPKVPKGQRHLEIRKVYYHRRAGGDEAGQFGDIFCIDGDDRRHGAGAPEGRTIEELLVDLKRMAVAIERPAISWDEWQAYVARTRVRIGRRSKPRR